MTTQPDPPVERFVTLQPGGKKGVSIDKARYDAIREALLEAIPQDAEGVDVSALTDLVRTGLVRRGFPREASVTWYVSTVKQDLEARGLLEPVPGTLPRRVRRV